MLLIFYFIQKFSHNSYKNKNINSNNKENNNKERKKDNNKKREKINDIIIIECSMKGSDDDAILAFTFCSRVLFVLNMAEKQS